MLTSQNRGHKIYSSNGIDWFYSSDGSNLKDHTGKIIERACTRCGKMPTKEGYDACIGYKEGYSSLCCGHGVSEKIEMKNNK